MVGGGWSPVWCPPMTSRWHSLDDYLRKRALANHVRGALALLGHLPRRPGRRLLGPRLAGVQHRDVVGKVRRNMADPVPAILLSRLAVDRKEQGHGLDKNLLRDAILRSAGASEIIGVRALVHALDDTARALYAHFDFIPSPTDPLHLLLLIKDARSAAGRSSFRAFPAISPESGCTSDSDA